MHANDVVDVAFIALFWSLKLISCFIKSNQEKKKSEQLIIHEHTSEWREREGASVIFFSISSKTNYLTATAVVDQFELD